MFHDSIYMKCTEEANLQRQKVDQYLPENREEGEEQKRAATANGYGVSLGGNENFVKLDDSDGCTTQ